MTSFLKPPFFLVYIQTTTLSETVQKMVLVLHAHLHLLKGHAYCWISAFNFLRITASFFSWKPSVVSSMLLFWCCWFIKLDLVTVGKFCFQFSCIIGSIVYYITVNHSTHVACKPRVCVLTIEGTILKETSTLKIFQFLLSSVTGVSIFSETAHSIK